MSLHGSRGEWEEEDKTRKKKQKNRRNSLTKQASGGEGEKVVAQQ